MWKRKAFYKYLLIITFVFSIVLILVAAPGDLNNFGHFGEDFKQNPDLLFPVIIKVSGISPPQYLTDNLSNPGAGIGNYQTGTAYTGKSIRGTTSSSRFNGTATPLIQDNKNLYNGSFGNPTTKPRTYKYLSIKYTGSLSSPVIPKVTSTEIPVSPPSSEARVIVDNSTREVEQRIFYYTNLERMKYGESAYIWDEQLAMIARDDCIDMATRSFFDHINPDGETPVDRAARHGYPTQKDFGSYTRYGVGENIAMLGNYPGTPDEVARFIVNAWMESPEHWANILDLNNSKYTNLGVGVAYNSTTDTWYAAQEFF